MQQPKSTSLEVIQGVEDESFRSSEFCKRRKFECNRPLCSFRIPRRRRSDQESQCSATKIRKGTWSKEECHMFFIGLRLFGYGSWKEIGTLITTRSTSQIKSYGQNFYRKIKDVANESIELNELNDQMASTQETNQGETSIVQTLFTHDFNSDYFHGIESHRHNPFSLHEATQIQNFDAKKDRGDVISNSLRSRSVTSYGLDDLSLHPNHQLPRSVSYEPTEKIDPLYIQNSDDPDKNIAEIFHNKQSLHKYMRPSNDTLVSFSNIQLGDNCNRTFQYRGFTQAKIEYEIEMAAQILNGLRHDGSI